MRQRTRRANDCLRVCSTGNTCAGRDRNLDHDSNVDCDSNCNGDLDLDGKPDPHGDPHADSFAGDRFWQPAAGHLDYTRARKRCAVWRG